MPLLPTRPVSPFSSLLLLLCALVLLPLPARLGAQDMDSFFDEPDGTTESEGTPSADSGDAEAGEEESESLGTLFETPDESVEDGAKEEQTEAVDIGELTTSPTTVTGNISAGIGAGVGLIEWPETPAAEGRSFGELTRYSGFYDTTASVVVDSRPEPYLRFRGSVYTNLDTDTMDFNNPAIGELFVDYTFADTLFVRAGKQGLTWGAGRLLDNPANLVDRVSDGVAVRATAPLGRGSLSGVVYTTETWVSRYSDIDPRSFAWAGLAESTAGRLSFSLSGHYQYDEPVGSAASLTFGLGSVSLTAEGVRNWDQEDATGGESSYEALGQVFWENQDRSWSLLGEYQYDSADTGGGEHRGGLGVVMPSLGGGGWRPGLRWRHAFEDNSGEVIPGISGTVAPRLSLSIGTPVIYGAPGSFYRDALTESVEEEDDPLEEDEKLVPVDNVVTVLLGLRLSFSF